MTDDKPCPRCGAPVSRFTHYVFVPSENRSWHAGCWKAKQQEKKETNEVGCCDEAQ